MSGCKDCNGGCEGCIPVGPIGPIGPTGNTGAKGNDGISIENTFVSDGTALIGGLLYPMNTLVIQYSDLTFESAGLIYQALPTPIPESQWIDLVMQNGWIAGSGSSLPQYAVYNGFLYFSGQINFSVATDETFATVVVTGVTGESTTVCATNSTPSEMHRITLSSTGVLKMPDYATANIDSLRLDTIVPLILR